MLSQNRWEQAKVAKPVRLGPVESPGTRGEELSRGESRPVGGVHDHLGVDDALVVGIGGEVVGHLLGGRLVAYQAADPVQGFQEIGQIVYLEEPIGRPGRLLASYGG